MPPQLVALTEGPDILLDKPIVMVGRHQECDILIPSRKISRRHCLIAQVNDYLVVRDLFSTNGIRVNGIRVKEGSLHAGDELTIGNFRYEVRLNGMPSTPQTPPPIAPLPAKLEVPRLLDDESHFESCEIPIALAEPAGLLGPPVVPGPGPMLPMNRSSFPPTLKEGGKDSPSPDVAKEAPVIPEQLDLAPLSGEIADRQKKPTA